MKTPKKQAIVSIMCMMTFTATATGAEISIRSNRVAAGYNLELNNAYNNKVNVGNGIMLEYIHSFSLSHRHNLYIDFGTRLDFARIGNVDFRSESSGYMVDADHYTDYTLRLPVSVAWRFATGNVTLMPYAGVQVGVMLHHEPNDHDGKVALRLPVGMQAGLGITHGRLYYGIEGVISSSFAPCQGNISVSVGYTF